MSNFVTFCNLLKIKAVTFVTFVTCFFAKDKIFNRTLFYFYFIFLGNKGHKYIYYTLFYCISIFYL